METVKNCTTCGYMRYMKAHDRFCEIIDVCHWQNDIWEYWREDEPKDVPAFVYDPISDVWDLHFTGMDWQDIYLRISLCSRGIDVRTESGSAIFGVDWDHIIEWKPCKSANPAHQPMSVEGTETVSTRPEESCFSCMHLYDKIARYCKLDEQEREPPIIDADENIIFPDWCPLNGNPAKQEIEKNV